MKLLKVYITDETAQALAVAHAITSDQKTDVINQAVLLYRQLLEAGQGKHARYTLRIDPWRSARIDVNRPWWRFW